WRADVFWWRTNCRAVDRGRSKYTRHQHLRGDWSMDSGTLRCLFDLLFRWTEPPPADCPDDKAREGRGRTQLSRFGHQPIAPNREFHEDLAPTGHDEVGRYPRNRSIEKPRG